MCCYMAIAFDPQTYVDATGNPIWEGNMHEDYNSLINKRSWVLVPLPSDHKIFKCKWVYMKNKLVNGLVSRYKTWLVGNGFQQVHNIDYDETFALVAKMDSILLSLAMVATRRWEVHHMYVKDAFLDIDLKEEIYMEQP